MTTQVIFRTDPVKKDLNKKLPDFKGVITKDGKRLVLSVWVRDDNNGLSVDLVDSNENKQPIYQPEPVSEVNPPPPTDDFLPPEPPPPPPKPAQSDYGLVFNVPSEYKGHTFYVAKSTQAFSEAWKANKEMLKGMGYYLFQGADGTFMVGKKKART